MLCRQGAEIRLRRNKDEAVVERGLAAGQLVHGLGEEPLRDVLADSFLCHVR